MKATQVENEQKLEEQKHNRRSPFDRISVRFVVFVIVATLLTGGAISLVAIKVSTDTIRQKILDNSRSEASLVAEFTSNYVEVIQANVESFSTRPLIAEYIILNDMHSATDMLIQFVQIQKVISASAIYDTNGIQLAVSTLDATTIGQSFADREWFQQVKSTNLPFQSAPLVSRTTGTAVAIYAVPIWNAKNQLIGFFTGGISLDKLSVVIGKINKVPSVDFSLIDLRNGGTIIANKDPRKILAPVLGLDDIMALMLNNKSGGLEVTNSDRSRSLVGFATTPNLPWGVIINTPSKLAFTSVNAFSQIAISLSAIILLIVAVLGGLFTLQLSRPIRLLVKETQEIGKGNLNYPIKIKGKSEIGDLSRAFSNMTGNLKKIMVTNENLSEEIDKRKQVEASLSDSQAFLQAAFDNSQAGIAIADAPDGKLRYVNKAGLMIRNKSEDDLVKAIDIEKYASSWNIFHLDGIPYEANDVPLSKAILYGEKSSEEFIIRRDNFEDRIVLANAGPIKDADDNIKAGIVVFQDITEKKRLDEKLIESELTYKALFDYSGVGIAYYTTDGYVISFNQKATETLGGSSADFAGKSIYDLYPKENAVLYLDRITKCAASNEPQNYDDLVQLPTGDKWFFSTYARILDANDLVKGVQIISHDISELKEKEKKISYLSYHDQLTGLYNRRFFEEELLRLDTSRNLPLTIAIGDVNGLKLINDSFGHKMGDQLLICVAGILRKACRQDDIIARVGGDEFSIIFPKTDEADADMIIQRINKLISQEKIGPLDFSIAFSSGTKTTDESIDSILKRAEDHMYRNKLNDSSSLRNGTIRLIMNTLFEKNNRELKHSERVSSLCVDIARALGLEKNEINHIRTAGLMHDIGKIGIDEHVLNSETKLSYEEWIEVKKHSEIGYRILSSAPDFSDIAEDVFSHHERWDGKGYPRGINGESISVYARIITIADAFDAMISERLYRTGDKSLRMEDAINEIKKNAGSQFDPVIAKVFVEKVLNVAW